MNGVTRYGATSVIWSPEKRAVSFPGEEIHTERHCSLKHVQNKATVPGVNIPNLTRAF